MEETKKYFFKNNVAWELENYPNLFKFFPDLYI